MSTTNYRKYTTKNPIKKFFLNNFSNQLTSLVQKTDASSILDVGCGEGFTLKKLKDKGIKAKMEGVENSKEAIGIAKKIHPDLKIKYGSIYKLPHKRDSFDLIICTEVLEHLENPKKAMLELKRVTKKYCILSVPNEPFFMYTGFLEGKSFTAFNNKRGHTNFWSKKEFIMLVEKYMIVKEIRSPFPWTLVLA